MKLNAINERLKKKKRKNQGEKLFFPSFFFSVFFLFPFCFFLSVFLSSFFFFSAANLAKQSRLPLASFYACLYSFSPFHTVSHRFHFVPLSFFFFWSFLIAVCSSLAPSILPRDCKKWLLDFFHGTIDVVSC